jgi:hypothetical protein
MDDDGGGPGDDLGSDDVVDPDDVQDLTEVSWRVRLWAFEFITCRSIYFINSKVPAAVCFGGLMWTVSSDMIELRNGLELQYTHWMPQKLNLQYVVLLVNFKSLKL